MINSLSGLIRPTVMSSVSPPVGSAAGQCNADRTAQWQRDQAPGQGFTAELQKLRSFGDVEQNLLHAAVRQTIQQLHLLGPPFAITQRP